MPGHALAVAGHLAEKMRAPADHILPEQIFNDAHKARVRQHVIDAPVAKMRGGNRIAVSARCQRFRQQIVEVAPDFCNFFRIEDANAGQVSIAIERLDLLPRERRRMSSGRRMEAQIAFDRAQVLGGRNEIGRRWRVHDLMLPVYRLPRRTPLCR